MSVTMTKMDVGAPERAGKKALAIYLDDAAEEMNDTLRAVAPRDTHELESGIRYQKFGTTERVFVSNAEHTEYVLKGTGVHGPMRRPIRPKRAKALRFTVDNQIVFAKSVKGMKPNDFVKRALEIEQPQQDAYFGRACAIVRRSGPN